MDFSRFLAPNLSQLPEGKSKNRGFFRYLGPTWANLGEKGVPRCPKTSQESQNGSNKRPKRAKMRPKGAPREPQWPPKYPKMFTQPSRRPHTTFLSQASMKPNVLRSKRGGFQGNNQEASKSAKMRPKTVPERPKSLPNGAQDLPKSNLSTFYLPLFSNSNFTSIFHRFFIDFLQTFKSFNLTKPCKNLGFFNVFW